MYAGKSLECVTVGPHSVNFSFCQKSFVSVHLCFLCFCTTTSIKIPYYFTHVFLSLSVRAIQEHLY